MSLHDWLDAEIAAAKAIAQKSADRLLNEELTAGAAVWGGIGRGRDDDGQRQ